MLFTEKYRPHRLDELLDQAEAKRKLRQFLKAFPKQKAAFLHGPPGTGKTSAALAIAEEHGWELIELNASDFRTASMIEERVLKAVQQRSLFSKGKLVLIDELEGLSGWYDKGGVKALLNVIKITPYPVIMTAQDADDKKLKDLKRASMRIPFQRIPYTDVYAFLEHVCREEHILYEENALKDLASRSSGDLRAALIDLQTLAPLGVTVETVKLLGERQRLESLEAAIIRILKATDPRLVEGVLDLVEGNVDDAILWLDENMPREYTKAEDRARAYAMLSRADVLQRRIRRRQYWRFLAYVYYFITIGISIAKEEKYPGAPRVERPRRPLLIWMKKQKREKILTVARMLADALHISLNEFLQEARFYSAIILKHSPDLRAWLEEHGVDREAILAFTTTAAA